MQLTDNRSTPEELAKRRSSEADDVLNKAHTSASKRASTSSTTTAELDVFKKALTAAGTKVCVTYEHALIGMSCMYSIHTVHDKDSVCAHNLLLHCYCCWCVLVHVTCLLTQHKQLAATMHSFDVNDDGLLSILQLESALRSLHVTHKQLSGTAIRRYI
jgi:hypothetical protein